MKIIQSTNIIDRTNSLECRKATINLNPATLHILSRDLYKQPIQSMIREILINGIDAHWEAKQTRPIDIKLPCGNDSTFYIRDYGTGIPHEQFMDIYLDYGASTKREDNKLHGGFGLGTKSPLAYTDCFFVTSFIDSIQNEYMIYYDEDNIPCVDYRYSGVTEEPNGLKVALTVHSNYDFINFRKSCITILQKIPSYVYNIIDKNIINITEADLLPKIGKQYGPIMIYAGNSIQIIMGYVAYNVDLYVVLEYLESHLVEINVKDYKVPLHQIITNITKSFTIEINATIGTYPVHPSKEYILITPKAIEYLQRDIQVAINVLYEDTDEINFISDSFRFKITNVLEEHKKRILITSKVVKPPRYSWEKVNIDSQNSIYLELIQKTNDLESNLVVAFLSSTEYNEYLGKGSTFIFPKMCPPQTALLFIEESGEIANLREIFINVPTLDLSLDIEERRQKDLLSKVKSKPRKVSVKSIQDPTHNILVLKHTKDHKFNGTNKESWSSIQHNVKTLKELKRLVFWVDTKYGCIYDQEAIKIIDRYKTIYKSIPIWNQPIIIGLPATRGTKLIKRHFPNISALNDWSSKFITSDYYIRRANIYLAFTSTFVPRKPIIDKKALIFGPYSWIIRLHHIASKYNTYQFSLNANNNSLIVQQAILHYKDIKLKIPWSTTGWGYSIPLEGLEQWIKTITTFTHQTPTGAKAKNDPYYLSEQ